ncbi:MAG: SAM-dependent methyltransferase [Chitinophagaceae bacterium]|nr:MAG: SAM-dependent methyltransferase [Chitinophagaceae bacterium]
MLRKIILTEDGSHTVLAGEKKLAFHSKHGALQESAHVYIHSAFDFVTAAHPGKGVKIFEMGFGTGLNSLLTYKKATENNIHVDYTTIETEPLTGPEARSLNYCQKLDRPDLQPVFDELHDATWETHAVINPFFTLRKLKVALEDYQPSQLVDLIYYDAFSPAAQPELWSKEMFGKLISFLEPGGILITYCSKGDVKRAMKAAGFKIKKVPGPLYKRDIIRATRPI